MARRKPARKPSQRPEVVEEAQIIRPERATPSAEEALSGWRRSSGNERSGSLPLSERARVEVCLPDLPKQAYQDLLDA
jgi:hypothetical protein